MKKFTILGAALALLGMTPLYASGAAEKKDGVQVVCAENTYGDLAQQIGGAHVHVLSILSDPNVDPHEYESNVDDARQIADADLVVENGGGYDDWMDKLMAATGNNRRTVIKAFDLAPTKLEENEHVWYDPDNVSVVAAKIRDVLKQKDPANAADYDNGYASLNAAIQKISSRLGDLKKKFQGVPIGLTETIFLYQSNRIGLQVLTPWTFEKAIAEGDDPSPADAVAAESQVKGKQVKALVYNVQTVTPITTKLQDEAKALGIPIVPVTETMPLDETYTSWMNRQLDALEAALGKQS